MSSDNHSARSTDGSRSTLVTSAVFIGAVGLVGVPVFFALVTVFTPFTDRIIAWLGGSAVAVNAVDLLVVLLAGVVALQLATEVASIQLHGVDALHRGSTVASGARLGAAIMLSLGFILAAGVIGLTTFHGGVRSGQLAVVGVGAVLTIVTLWSAAIGGRSLLSGYRSVPTSRGDMVESRNDP